MHERVRCPCQGVDTIGALPKEEGILEQHDGTKGPARHDRMHMKGVVWCGNTEVVCNVDGVLSMETGGMNCLSAACLCNVHFPYMRASTVKDPK